MARPVLLGLFSNLLVLVGFAIFYQLALAPFVVTFHRARFMGDFWFVGLVALVLPTYLFLRNRKAMALGALLGFAAYLALIPLAFFRGD